jgi:hypothetical protein
MKRAILSAMAACACLASAPQDPREKSKDKVDGKKVNEAIDKGAAFLIKRYADGINNTSWNSPIELVVLTLSHCNVKPDHPVLAKCLEGMLSSKLHFTYRVALQAMALQRLDPKKHLDRIAACAQWLVDTQCAEGEWGYPGTLSNENEHPKKVEVDPPKKEGDAWKVQRRKRPDPKVKGDQSNAQFALLGLRAAQESGVEIPKETWASALRFQLATQRPDGGWGYYFRDMRDKTSYGSLTLAGTCAVAICRYYLGTKDPLKDPAVQKGIQWMARRLDFGENPLVTQSNVIDPRAWHYYYLYSIERTGILCNTEKFGDKEWYPGGAQFLLLNQSSDGSWTTGARLQWKAAGSMEAPDTCFALLFLTRSTPPLVETGDQRKDPPRDPPK